jgi:2-polyprenyl-6-methoxyphenol hydroxylase-like FAD-dependent oxidoreductase
MPTPPEAATPATERQILVVGSGVDGVATAAFLRHSGLSPVVVAADGAGPTRAAEGCESTRPRPVVLWRPALSLLDDLGVGDTLRSVGEPIREWRLHHDADGTTERLSRASDGDDWAVAVERNRLRKRLREPLSSAHLRLSKTPQRVEPTDHGLRVDFADGVRERFDAVVGADGVQSWVREARTGDAGATSWGTTEWSVSTDGRGTAGTVVDVWTPSALFTCHPSGCGLFVIPTTDRTGEPHSRAVATSHLTSLLDCVDALAGDVTLGAPRRHLTRSADQWATGRVGFVGSAARSIQPTVPIGPSLTIEAAATVAREFVRSSTVVEALRRYARCRRRRLRTLDRRASFRATAADRDADPVGTAHAVRTAALRSFFGSRYPPLPADVAVDP